MPNHVWNVLKFNSQVIPDALINDEGKVDFNRIIPMDLPHPNVTSVILTTGISPGVAKELAVKWREDNSYDALSLEEKKESLKKFITEISLICGRLGTFLSESIRGKEDELPLLFENCLATGHFDWYSWNWNNWGTKWNAYDEHIDLKSNTISFNTAWAAPHQVIAKIISMFPEESFSFEWADEDLGVNCGYLTVENGKITNIRRASLADEPYIRTQWLFFAKELTGCPIYPKDEIDCEDQSDGSEDYRVIIQDMGMDPLKIMAPVVRNACVAEPVKEKETC